MKKRNIRQIEISNAMNMVNSSKKNTGQSEGIGVQVPSNYLSDHAIELALWEARNQDE